MSNRSIVVRSPWIAVLSITALGIPTAWLFYSVGAGLYWGLVPAMGAAFLFAAYWPVRLTVQEGRFTIKSPFGTCFEAPVTELLRVQLRTEVRGSGKSRQRVYPVTLESRDEVYEVDAPSDYLSARRLSESIGLMGNVEIVDAGMGEVSRRSANSLSQRWVDTVPLRPWSEPPCTLSASRSPGRLEVRLPGQLSFYWLIAFLFVGGAGWLGYTAANHSLPVGLGVGGILLVVAVMALSGPRLRVEGNNVSLRYPLGLRESLSLDDLQEIRFDPAYGGLLLLSDFQVIRVWSPLDDESVAWLRHAVAWAARA